MRIANNFLSLAIEQLMNLLSEKITIGSKSRIQKIIILLDKNHKEFLKLHTEILTKYGAKEIEGKIVLENPSPEFLEEYTELSNLENTITADPIDFSKIENIETSNVYDMTVLAPFFENL